MSLTIVPLLIILWEAAFLQSKPWLKLIKSELPACPGFCFPCLSLFFFCSIISPKQETQWMANWPKYFVWCVTVSSSLKVRIFESIAWLNWLILHLWVPLSQMNTSYSSCCSTFYPAPCLWESSRGWTRGLETWICVRDPKLPPVGFSLSSCCNHLGCELVYGRSFCVSFTL